MIWASGTGYIEVVKLLLENNIDVNAKEESGRTASMIVSEAGHTEIVKFLTDARAKE